jgi:hypothetical protein
MSKSEILSRIVREAEKYKGLEEIRGNAGWESQEFENMMRQVGWHEGYAWCQFFVKMIYYKIFGPIDYGEVILSNFTGSATETFKNCKNSPRFTTDTKNEVAGCVVIFRLFENGKPSWKGHAGIVTEAGGGEYGSHFQSIDGNTSPSDVRTGGMVAFNTCRNNYNEKVTDGLKLEGFIFPPVPLEKLDPEKIELPL